MWLPKTHIQLNLTWLPLSPSHCKNYQNMADKWRNFYTRYLKSYSISKVKQLWTAKYLPFLQLFRWFGRRRCCQRLRAGERGDRGWDGWMASLAQWIWVWANSRVWWRTGRPACCTPWRCKKSDTTKQQNNNCLEGWQEKLWGRKGALEINMDVVTNYYLLQEPRFCTVTCSHTFDSVAGEEPNQRQQKR